jgi:cytochrome P450
VSQPIPFNPYDPQYTSDPRAFFAPLRETAPVQPATLPDGQAVWLLTRYADVEAALTEPRLVKDPRLACSPEELARMPAHPEAMRYLSHQMLSRDPPDQALQQTAAEILVPREITALSAAASAEHCRSAHGRSTSAGVQKVEIRQGEKEGA